MAFEKSQKVTIVFGKVKSSKIMDKCGGKELIVVNKIIGNNWFKDIYHLSTPNGDVVMDPDRKNNPFDFVADEIKLWLLP